MAENAPRKDSSRHTGVLAFFVVGGLLLGSATYNVLIPQNIRMILKLSLPIVLPILVLHFATGGSMDDLYLKAGNIRLSLIVGGIGFAAFAGIGMLQAMGSGLMISTVIASLPWVAAFTFANAFMEELWFRALFLKKLGPLVGVKTAIAATSVVFALVHVSVTYASDILVFMVALLALALIWSWLMHRSNSIWGAHAGGDVLVMIGFLVQSAAR